MQINVITQPTVSLVSSQIFHKPEKYGFWNSTADNDPDALVEFGGRLCYLSFGSGEVDGHKTIRGRTSNQEYLDNIKNNRHGAVIEHAVFGVLIEGVSRSLTHELVRHRHFSYSQLSQRYVDESNVAFVLPPEIQMFDANGDPTGEYIIWREGCERALRSYRMLLERISHRLGGSSTDTLKRARQTARSLLPNAVETKIVMTGNARAWRHFFDMRGAAGADSEIRRLAVAIFEILRIEAPGLFGDISVTNMIEEGNPVPTVLHVGFKAV